MILLCNAAVYVYGKIIGRMAQLDWVDCFTALGLYIVIGLFNAWPLRVACRDGWEETAKEIKSNAICQALAIPFMYAGWWPISLPALLFFLFMFGLTVFVFTEMSENLPTREELYKELVWAESKARQFIRGRP